MKNKEEKKVKKESEKMLKRRQRERRKKRRDKRNILIHLPPPLHPNHPLTPLPHPPPPGVHFPSPSFSLSSQWLSDQHYSVTERRTIRPTSSFCVESCLHGFTPVSSQRTHRWTDHIVNKKKKITTQKSYYQPVSIFFNTHNIKIQLLPWQKRFQMLFCTVKMTHILP